MTRRWPRRLGVGLVAIAILVTAAVILLWLTRVELVSWTAARLLERQGLGPASFVVDAVGFQGLRAHDVVLLAGKGHEKEQILADRTVPFDDAEVALSDLEELGYGEGR